MESKKRWDEPVFNRIKKVTEKNLLGWIVIPLATVGISLILIWEIIKPSANFWLIFFLVVLAALGIALFCKVCFEKKQIKSVLDILLKMTPVLTIIGILISADSDVFTQSDGHIYTSLKRIYDKENSIDLSEIQNPKKPHLVIVLDMSNSLRNIPIDGELHRQETKYLYERLKHAFTNVGISESKSKEFFSNIMKDNIKESDLYKLRLFDFVSQVQHNYDIHLVCFGVDPILSEEFKKNEGWALKNIFEYITKWDKEHQENRKQTDFVALFDKIIQIYKHEEEASKYSFVFFSDYIHESEKYFSPNEIKDRITQFCNSAYFSSFYYLDHKSEKEYMEPNKKGINIFPILKESIRKETGRFTPITDGNIELFNISSHTIISVYYECTYYENKCSETKITFDNIDDGEKKHLWNISLESNIEKEMSYHHQFKGNEGEDFPIRRELAKSTPLSLSISGRIVEQFPCHSLVFCAENKGCCRFDIVFFKDFPWYVRYIVTFLFILLAIIAWLWLFCRENDGGSAPAEGDAKKPDKPTK
jgi:hypothetical protein